MAIYHALNSIHTTDAAVFCLGTVTSTLRPMTSCLVRQQNATCDRYLDPNVKPKVCQTNILESKLAQFPDR